MFDMGFLDETIAEKILDDRLDHRLVMAKYHLDKIKGNYDLNGGWRHFYFTTHLESFIMFSNNAIELLTREIYNSLSHVTDEQKISIYRTKKNLILTKESKQINTIIPKYFSYPKERIGHLDYSNSSLWCLKEIRNRIFHGKFLIRTVSSSPDGSGGIGFEIPYPLKKEKGKVISQDRVKIHDSDEYFDNLYQNLVQFA